MRGLIFAGDKEIGKVCLNALQKKYENIHIMQTNSEIIISQKRKNDVIINSFSESEYKFVFLAGWDKLISFQELTKKRFINLHGSILPKYRGTHSIFWAIMNGEKELGYTIHEVNENIDDGDIIYQYKFSYNREKISEIFSLFYKDIDLNLANEVQSYVEGKTNLFKQDFNLASWVPKRNLDDCIIDFCWPNEILDRFLLALTPPYPRPRIKIKNIIYEVIEYELLTRNYFCDVGRVVNVDKRGVWIKTKEGLMIISSLMDVNLGKCVNPREILKIGYRFSK